MDVVLGLDEERDLSLDDNLDLRSGEVPRGCVLDKLKDRVKRMSAMEESNDESESVLVPREPKE